MARTLALAATAVLLAATPALGQGACRLCYSDPGGAPGERPLALEIWTDLNFSKLALTGTQGGAAAVDASGAKSTQGQMIDLGGMAVTGRGRISGMPLREVRIDLPGAVPMSTPDGSHAELVDFTTDLPPHPRLDASGVLEFSFGARLLVHGGQGGNFRGRIPISVDYN